MKKVVGTLFLKDGKLLLDKPRKRPTYQMIGGSVEEGEDVYSAAVRECSEELGPNAIFNKDKIEFIMDFEEIATNDPNLKIHMHVFIYTGELEGELSLSDEIEGVMWFGVDDDFSLLSNTLKNEVVPYCLENGWIYK
jgi:ADP-ribose pyrophosphatase